MRAAAGTCSAVAFPAISDYLDVLAGAHRIAVAPAGAGESAAVITANPALESGMAYTVVAVGQLANIKGQIYNDKSECSGRGQSACARDPCLA